MIHVTPQKEPAGFAEKVAIPGKKWLLEQKWYDSTRPEGEQTVPPRTEWDSCWTKVGKELYNAYNGVCAYLGIRFELATGTSSVDHFLPKTKYPGLAYRWENYRLSCLGENRRKGQKTDILDPFEVDNGWFDIKLGTGRVCPVDSLAPTLQAKIQDTITELKLNNNDCCEMRLHRIALFFVGIDSQFHFRLESPFLWHVLNRHNLLTFPVPNNKPRWDFSLPVQKNMETIMLWYLNWIGTIAPDE